MQKMLGPRQFKFTDLMLYERLCATQCRLSKSGPKIGKSQSVVGGKVLLRAPPFLICKYITQIGPVASNQQTANRKVAIYR